MTSRIPTGLRDSINRVRLQFDITTLIFLSFPTLTFIIFLITPLIGMLGISFTYKGAPSLEWFIRIFTSEYYINFQGRGTPFYYNEKFNMLVITGSDYGVILNSLIVASIVTITTTIWGIILAVLFSRYDFRGRDILRVLSMFPLLLSPFVNALVIKKIFNPYNGFINWLLHDTLGILPFRLYIDGLAGIALTQMITYYPIVALNIYSSMLNIDPSMEEQGINLGADGFRLLRKITIPLSYPGIMSGATLVFIFSLEDLTAPIVFHGHPLAKKLISFQIYTRFISETGLRSPEIAALAVLLLTIALTVFVLIRNYVSLRSYAMVSKGRTMRKFNRLGWKGYLIVYLIVLPILILTSLPQIGVILLAFSTRWVNTVFPEGFTLANILEVYANPSVFRYLQNSITYAIMSLFIVFILALSTAYVTNRVKVKGISLIDLLSTSPIALPGIVIAISYFYFYATLFRDTFLDPTNVLYFNPLPILITGYAIRRLPFALRAIYAGIQQVHVNLEEAALNVGASRFLTIRKILLPMISPNVLSGLLISFIYIVGEVSISIIIGILNMDYAPLTVYMRDVMLSAVGSQYVAAALGFTLMMMQLAVIIIITFVFKQRYAYIGI